MNTKQVFPMLGQFSVFANCGTDSYAKNSPYIEDISRIAASADMWTLAGKCVFVTGAAGLIGTVLVGAMMEANRLGAGIHGAEVLRKTS